MTARQSGSKRPPRQQEAAPQSGSEGADQRADRGDDPVVVKIGGSIAADCDPLLDELATREDIVLVHGFGPQTTAECDARGIEQRTIRSPTGMTSRFTDETIIDAMREAADGVAQGLSERLQTRGVDVARVLGDQGVIEAQAKPALRHETEDGRVMLVRGNRSGRVEHIDPGPILAALDEGNLPLLTPLGIDEQGLVSVDADRAAAALAGAIQADALVLLTDVPGLLEDPEDTATRVDALSIDAIEELLGSTVTGGMARKLIAAREAIEAGVERTLVADGTAQAPIERALSGEATEVTR